MRSKFVLWFCQLDGIINRLDVSFILADSCRRICNEPSTAPPAMQCDAECARRVSSGNAPMSDCTDALQVELTELHRRDLAGRHGRLLLGRREPCQLLVHVDETRLLCTAGGAGGWLDAAAGAPTGSHRLWLLLYGYVQLLLACVGGRSQAKGQGD
jgi:hypothetical protein